jgi:hypothetical protein
MKKAVLEVDKKGKVCMKRRKGELARQGGHDLDINV